MSATQDKNGNPILFWTYQNGNTWMWDNGVWSTNPLSNYQANVLSATQFANGTPTVFGSFAGLAGTWEFNGSVWTTVSSYQAVALSATRAFSGGPVCLGAFNNLAGTWEWNGTVWTGISNYNASVISSSFTGSGSTVNYTAFASFSNLSGTWQWNSSGGGWGSAPTNANHATLLSAGRDSSGNAVCVGIYSGIPGTYQWSSTNGWTEIYTWTTGTAATPAATPRLTMTTPQSTTAGSPITVTVTAVDPFGNTLTSYNGTASLTSSDPQAVLPSNLTLTNGVGQFTVTLITAGAQNLTATDTANSSFTGTSSSITVSAATASKLAFGQQPTTTTAGNAISPSVTVLVEDPYGNVVTGNDSTITLSSSTTAFTGNSLLSVTASGGVATFSAVDPITAGNTTLTASDASLVTATSNSFTVKPGAAATLILAGVPSAVAGGAPLNNLTVTAKDLYGNIATGYTGTVHFSSSDGQATFQPAQTTLTNGMGAFNATLFTFGSQTITATDTVNSNLTCTATINVTPHFSVSAPSTATVGTPFNITVTALDGNNHTVTGYAGIVYFTGSDPLAFLPTNVTLTNGVGTFNATLYTVGSQSITATDTVNSTNTGSTNPISVNSSSPATHFSFVVSPTETAGTALNITVTALDQYGNTATDYTGTVQFTSSDGQASLPPNSTLTNGTGNFSVTLKTAGNQTISVTDTTNSNLTSTTNTISVSPATAAQFAISAPYYVSIGVPFSITVTALDAYNNIATGYTGTVQFTTTDKGTGVVLPSNYTFTSGDAGVYTFSDVTLETAGTQTLTATDTANNQIQGHIQTSVYNYSNLMATWGAAFYSVDVTANPANNYVWLAINLNQPAPSSPPAQVAFLIGGGGGTATQGVDYSLPQGSGGTYTFQPGQTTYLFPIQILDPGNPQGIQEKTIFYYFATTIPPVGTGPISQGYVVIHETNNVPPSIPSCPTCGGQLANLVQAAPGSTGNVPAEISPASVRYFDGTVQYSTVDISSAGFGTPWGVTRYWSNGPGYANGSTGNGPGWGQVQAPMLLDINGNGSTIAEVANGTTALYFDLVNGVYQERFFGQEKLAGNDASGFVLTDALGDQITFNGFSSSLPANQRGQIEQFVDPYGNLTYVASHTANGNIQEVLHSSTVGGTTVTEGYSYTYLTSGVNSGLLASVLLWRSVNNGVPTNVEEVIYAYYDGTQSYGGNSGDLMTATTEDFDASGAPHILNEDYYRYYTSSNLLEFVFTGASYERLVTVLGSISPPSATDAQVAPYADSQYVYDQYNRVITAVIQGAGSSTGTGDGLGTYTYSYTGSDGRINRASTAGRWKPWRRCRTATRTRSSPTATARSCCRPSRLIIVGIHFIGMMPTAGYFCRPTPRP